LLIAAAGLLPAQIPEPLSYRRHTFTVGGGAGLPRGELRPLFSDSFGLALGYGYRFHRFFQADVGVDMVIGAAGVRDYLNTDFGDRRIRDYQLLVPFGGRAILPLFHERLQFYGGGGGTHFRYFERLSQPSEYFRLDCPVCTARNGWGYYATVGMNVAVDRAQHFRLGVASRVYRGHTDGDPLGPVPGVRTRDHWVNVMGEFGFSF
jgi:hypothetical protein